MCTRQKREAQNASAVPTAANAAAAAPAAADAATKNKKAPRKRCFRLSKKASQNFPRERKTKLKSFSARACTWRKILHRLQVWNLYAKGVQIMRVADCKKLAEKPEGVFRQAQADTHSGICFLLARKASFPYAASRSLCLTTLAILAMNSPLVGFPRSA